jgi:acetylornithine deacetylase
MLLEAVAAYSPSYSEEPAAQVFAARLQEAGLQVERQPLSAHPGGGARGNLLARLGPQPPSMLWIGHLDTIEAVHGFPAPRLEEDLLYGLGAADMKGGCAAMVEAAGALCRAGAPLARGLCLGLVAGEEEYGDGAQALIEAVRAPLVVVGEPTGLVPCISHNGYQEWRLSAEGSRAHAAVPEFGANAIHAMLTWILGLYDGILAPELAGQVVANPREIQGGSTLFVVPAGCQAMLDMHWRPGVDPAEVGAAIERARQAAGRDHPLCRLEAQATFTSMGYENDPGDPLLAPLWRACASAGLPAEPGIFRSHSDAAVFQRAGSLAVVCGPGRLEMAHSPEEQVSLGEVERAAELYAALAWEALV